MTEAHIGRLLAACLHQSILDVLPQRIDFYENWLKFEGLRDGTIGLAPITAVVGFLRTEGAAHDAVMSRAGALAADWTVESLPGFRRRTMAWLPRPLRVRAALRLSGDIVRSICSASRASVKVRRNQARVEVRDSLFCSVREARELPLCAFYVAVAVVTLRHFGIGAQATVEQCRAVSGGTCVIALALTDAVAEPAPAIAA